MPSVGTNVPRKDAIEKVTGTAKYVDDLVFPGMLHARTIRSTIARGRIRDLRFEFDRAGFTIVDHRDITGRNVVALIEDDQPLLAEREIRHVAEPVALLAHEDLDVLRRACVEIHYEPLEPLFDPLRSTQIFKHLRIDKGDVEAALTRADLIVEGEYRAGHQEQLYIEPNGVVAVPENGGVTLYGSLQCPYYVHRALTVLLGLPAEQVRVVQTETGGGFGGKEEYPPVIAGHA